MKELLFPRTSIGIKSKDDKCVSKRYISDLKSRETLASLIIIFNLMISGTTLADTKTNAPTQSAVTRPTGSMMPNDVTPSPVANSSQKIEQIKAQIRKTPRNLLLVIDLAQEFYNIGDYEKTTLLLWKQVENLNHKGLILLLKAHHQRGDTEQVIKVAQMLIVKNPKDAEAHTYEGLAHLSKVKVSDSVELKKSKEKVALESFKKAIEADSKYQPAYEAIEKIYDNPKRPNFYELRMLYQDMIDNIGGHFEFYQKLCKINALDGVNEPAIEACTKSMQLNDEIPENYVFLARAHKQMGNSEKTMKLLKDASAKFPKSDFVLESYAKYLEDDKNFIDAYKYYDQCVSVAEKNEACLAGAATSGVQIQKYEKGLQYLIQACAISRKHSVLARKLASVIRASKAMDWVRSYEVQAEKCAGH